MTSALIPVLEPLGLGVARIALSAANPALIEVEYYGGSRATGSPPRPARKEFRSETPVRFPGKFKLPDAELELTVERSSDCSFVISVCRDSIPLARGLGLIDRDDPAAVLAAWWTKDIEPYGVVKYSIRDERTVVGYYISKMTPEDPGEDIAVGDTSHGFRGDYVLNSREVNGRTWGPHEWRLTPRGKITDLTWWENGRMFCRGVGMSDPQDSRSIIATYIAL
jgi:hypothetical protein